MNVRWRISAAVAAAALVAVAGCGGESAGASAPVGEPQHGGTLVTAWNSDAQSLDAARCGQNLNWGPCQALYGTLLNYDAGTGEFSPGMAESLTSDDGLVWTLRLREGTQFSDGTPFDADAVVLNWDRVKDPVNLSPGASIVAGMSYEVVDPRTVRISLEQPNWQFRWAMYNELAFIASPTAIREKGADFANAPVGAGPFVFDSWSRGTRITLSRNATYWDQPRPYLDRIEFAVIGADNQRMNALRSGEVDVAATLETAEADRVVSEGYVDHTLQQVGGAGVRISHRTGPLADPDVRLAIGKLIDAQQINDAFYPGDPAATTFSPPGSTYFDAQARFPEQDVAGAQRLIDGYRAHNGGGEVVVTYKLVAGIPLQDQIAQMFQAQVQRVRGLRLEIVPLDAAAFIGDLNSGNYELLLASMGGVNPDYLYQVFHTGGSQNTSGYSNPATDAALEQARATQDPAEQLAAFKAAMRHVAADLVQRSWRYQTTHLLAEDTVQGIQPNYTYYLRSDLVWKQQD